MRKGGELKCVAVHLPTGIDVRLMEGKDFRRKLVRGAAGCETHRKPGEQSVSNEAGKRSMSPSNGRLADLGIELPKGVHDGAHLRGGSTPCRRCYNTKFA